MKLFEWNVFERLGELKFLYIYGNELVVFKLMFEGLCNLERLWIDLYIICCVRFLIVDVEKCIFFCDCILICD